MKGKPARREQAGNKRRAATVRAIVTSRGLWIAEVRQGVHHGLRPRPFRPRRPVSGQRHDFGGTARFGAGVHGGQRRGEA